MLVFFVHALGQSTSVACTGIISLRCISTDAVFDGYLVDVYSKTSVVHFHDCKFWQTLILKN